MQRLIYEQDDGTIAIIIPAPGRTVTDMHRAVPPGRNAFLVLESEIPADRYFRNAWVLGQDKKPTVDLPRARDIHINNLRRDRDVKLAALDVAFMRAVETNDLAAQAQIAADKQALRDLPATVASDLANINDLAVIKNHRPSILDS